mmetsp:Transcript_28625/g.89151  ORF Transcript_28625/g.89151 Transcript_28625/m.89151 type:complete len:110 (+) Transcript_28625:31-360(+)
MIARYHLVIVKLHPHDLVFSFQWNANAIQRGILVQTTPAWFLHGVPKVDMDGEQYFVACGFLQVCLQMHLHPPARPNVVQKQRSWTWAVWQYWWLPRVRSTYRRTPTQG